MSTASGLAAVTAVLKDVLINGLLDHDATSTLGDVLVTAQAPDRIELPESRSQLNLFLYLVTPNQGWRNVGQPARDARGDLISAPPLALDLHYLLTAYGAKDFHAEILLGYAMQLMHEMPVLTRPAIRAALAPSLLVSNEDVPSDLRDLFLSGIADQIEQLKVCQTFLTTEEMFKLWMAFQAPYRPTAAYHVSVVLIESKRQGKSAPPVRRFGVATTQLRQPVIAEIRSRAQVADPFVANRAIVIGNEIALVGNQLKGEDTKAFVGEREITAADGLTIADDQVTFPYGSALRPGIHPVSVTHQMDLGDPPVPHGATVSNALPLVLSPNLTAIVANITSGSGASDTTPRAGTLTATVSPDVGQIQQASILLNEFGPPSTRPARAYRLVVPPRTAANAPPASATLTVSFTDLLPATYVARIRVDGAESPLGVNPAGAYDSPTVQIP